MAPICQVECKFNYMQMVAFKIQLYVNGWIKVE